MRMHIVAAALLALTCFCPSVVAQHSSGTTGAAPDSELCWSQLDLLKQGDKLTAAEAAVFEAQCTCLEQIEQGDARSQCAQHN